MQLLVVESGPNAVEYSCFTVLHMTEDLNKRISLHCLKHLSHGDPVW